MLSVAGGPSIRTGETATGETATSETATSETATSETAQRSSASPKRDISVSMAAAKPSGIGHQCVLDC